MSKKLKTEDLPIFGKPMFKIGDYTFSDKIEKASKVVGCLSPLRYFATDAVMVMGVEFVDDTMQEIIINKGTDVELSIDRSEIGETVFFNKEEADLIAQELNLQQKATCKEIADIVMNAFYQYDDIVLAHQPRR